MSREKSTLEQLNDAIEAAQAAAYQLERARSAEKEDDLDGYYRHEVRDMFREQIRLNWKLLLAPVLEELQRRLAKAERDRDELIRRAARALP
jgi:hypothetical protein